MKQNELFSLIKHADYKTVGDDLDYCVTEIGGRPALLFQGSMTWRDYVNDFKFARKLYKNQTSCMVVHGGFGRLWKSGNDQIVFDISQACLKHPGAKPIIAGWSLGGAIALLAAEDLFWRTGWKADVFTFGAPKVCGSKKTAEYIDQCCCAVQYRQPNDLVPYLPLLPGFCHADSHWVGRRFSLIEIFKVKKYHIGYGKGELYD